MKEFCDLNKLNWLSCVLLLVLCACASNRSTGPAPKHATEKRYCIKNVCYQPIRKYDYSAIGEASWYGTFENGCPTATGYIFNKDFMTAAHRTLPLPCVVEVTNLENGKKEKIFVNDRGPFCNTSRRIIDLSARSAKELGIFRKGLAKVRIRCLPYESMLASLYYGRTHYHPNYQSKTTLTPNERRYIKEKIIRDYTNDCESLSKKRKKTNCRKRSCYTAPKKSSQNLYYGSRYVNSSRKTRTKKNIMTALGTQY